MARPTKDDIHKRTLTIRVRVTTAERERLWQLARDSGYTPSDFLRVRALASPAVRRVPPPDRAALLALLAELGKIGSNVNQIARALNSQQAPIPQPEVVRTTLTGVDALTAQLLRLLHDGHSG